MRVRNLRDTRLHYMMKALAAVACALALALPSAASAATLSSAQASAIVGLLQAFSVDSATVLRVEQILGVLPPARQPTAPPAAPHVPVVGSLYPSSSIGYDLSFNTTAYPATDFGFAVVGVTGGKAFVHNARLASEYSWARLASVVSPTLYMNLNAPYGSTVAGHVATPQTCAAPTVGTTTEPTDCAGYNYGYNAAADAFAYATSAGLTPPFWWLDIEEANSWSADPSVNDATIQGAIDYLNKQGIRVGIYSVPSMWANIAGAGFTPTQTMSGSAVTTPNWFAVGIMSQVGAINSCLTASGFIPGSPVWVIQYEANSTAVDQNIAC